MKTKIFVCGSSGIDYISHNDRIASIPTIIKFSKEEFYDEGSGISADALYQRMKLDKTASPEISYQDHSGINALLEKTIKREYEQVLFITSSEKYCELYMPISIAKEAYKDISCYIYKSQSISYSLASLAITADSMLSNGEHIEDVITALNKLEANCGLFLFSPAKVHEDFIRFNKNYKIGKAYRFVDGALKSLTSYDEMFNQFKIACEKSNVSLYITYTDKASNYLPLFEEEIGKIIPDAKKIKYIPLTPVLGVELGGNAFGIGYIKEE